MEAGWFRPVNMKRAHYYRGPVSLCGGWTRGTGQRLERPRGIDCPRCKAALEAEKKAKESA